MRDLTKIGMRINARMGRAINNYNLIESGDRILVAVSGGKDSLTLLTMLKKIQAWSPVRYDLVATNIRTDFHCGGCIHQTLLSAFFKKIDVPFVFRDIEVLDEHKKTNCFWCSWCRRKALFAIADEFHCNKIAFGHHKDDVVETLLMNLFFKGNISTMNPRQEMFEGKIHIIRPLCYVEEQLVRDFAKESGFPEQHCRCPFGKDSRRKYVKDFISETQKIAGQMNIRTNLFNSVSRIRENYVDLKPER